MAADAATVLRKNVFWVILGAGALLDVGLYFHLVEGAQQALEERMATLQQNTAKLRAYATKDQIRTDRWAQSYTEKEAAYRKSYEETLAYYLGLDDPLDPIFKDVRQDAATGRITDTAKFQSVLMDEYNRLEARFSEKVKFAERASFFRKLDGGENAAQKRFWVQQALVEHMLAGGVVRFHGIHFPDANAKRKDIPDELGLDLGEGKVLSLRPIKVDLTCEMLYTDLGRLLNLILVGTLSDASSGPCFRLRALDLKKISFVTDVYHAREFQSDAESAATSDDAVIAEVFQAGKLLDKQEEAGLAGLALSEPPLLVVLKLDVLDLEEEPAEPAK